MAVSPLTQIADRLHAVYKLKAIYRYYYYYYRGISKLSGDLDTHDIYPNVE